MDPLTALSVAGTVIQFVDFSTKLLLGAKELYEASSGALSANDQLELVTSDLQSVLSKLEPVASTGNQYIDELEASFAKICIEASAIAKELTKRLESLKVDPSAKDHRRAIISFYKAVESAWTRTEREDLKRQLKELKDALETRILVSFRAKLDLFSMNVSERFDNLDKQTQNIISALSVNQSLAESRLSHAVTEQTSTLALLLSRLETNDAEYYRKSRADILDDENYRKLKRDIVGRRERDITPIIEILDVSSDKEARLRIRVGQTILDSLRYENMSARYEGVADAHQNTFSWIFDEPTNPEQPETWANFLEWLRHGDGLYWITGKPGSGKTTLMKSMFDDDRLRQNLQAWASDRPLYFASFFFWNSGTRDQKSQQGMIRSLLFQVLNSQPDLIPTVFPLQWARTYSGLAASTPGLMNETWGLKPLMIGFRALTQQQLVKLCFLIDGLDEFEGYPEEMTQLCLNASSSNVKVCVSSRPWNVFEECFENCPGLRLQDLTKADIQFYVEDKFTNNSLYRGLSERDPISASVFVEEISTRADGVFLWVKLVVQSLLDGMRDRDAVEDLQSRLYQLPQDLELLYRHLLTLIQQVHLGWASRAFQIFRISQAHETSIDQSDMHLTYQPAREEPSPLTILGLYLALDGEISPNNSKRWSLNDCQDACQNATFHLTARCAGLLEVIGGDRKLPLKLDSRIQYLHRTTRDFLMQPDVWSGIISHTLSTFDPEVSLFKSCVLQLSINHTQTLYLPTWKLAHHALTHASRAESKPSEASEELLDNLELIVSGRHKSDLGERSPEFWQQYLVPTISNVPKVSCFLQFAVIYGLTSYIERKLSASPELFESPAASLLHYAFPAPPARPLHNSAHLGMIKVLIKAGEDPNNVCMEYTPWQRALWWAYSSKRSNIQPVNLHIFATLLEAGADPDAQIHPGGISFSVQDVLQLARKSHNEEPQHENDDVPTLASIEALSSAINQAIGKSHQHVANALASGASSTSDAIIGHKKSKKKRLRSWIKQLGAYS